MDKSDGQENPSNAKAHLNAPITPELRGETMAYALQSGLGHLAGNIYEPWIDYQVQKHYARGTSKHGTYGQNFAGEVIGDVAGAAALIAAETLFPRELHGFLRRARSWCDPLYTGVARIALGQEACEPDFEQRIEKWKTFQERNLVRSGIIGVVGIAANVSSQKILLNNPSPTSVVFKGKLLSTAVSTGIMLTARMLFAKRMKQMDEWLGEKVFEPMLSQDAIHPVTGQQMKPSEMVSNPMIEQKNSEIAPPH